MNSDCSAGINKLVAMLFISITLVLVYFILISFISNIIDEIIKLVDHLYLAT